MKNGRNNRKSKDVRLPFRKGSKDWQRSEAGQTDALARKMLVELDWSDGWELRNSKASIYAKRNKEREEYIQQLSEPLRDGKERSKEDIEKRLATFDLRTERALNAIGIAVKMHCKEVMGSRV